MENLCGVSSSPKTPVKKSSSGNRATWKDTFCLVCGSCLIGERCTYNFQQNNVLRQKLEIILEEMVDFNVNSYRVCRPCGCRIEALEKKFQVVMEQVRELRGKYSNSCRRNVTVKRLSKASPSPKAYKKPRQGQILTSTPKEGEHDDITACFQPLPDDTVMEVLDSSMSVNSEVLLREAETTPAEKMVVQASVYLTSVTRLL